MIEDVTAAATEARRLGAAIRARRLACRMTADALAAAIGVSPIRLLGYENGTGRLAATRLAAIAAALATTCEALCDAAGLPSIAPALEAARGSRPTVYH